MLIIRESVQRFKESKMKKTLILLLLALFAFPAIATVSDGETVRQSFTLGAATTTFTFTFKCNSSDDVLVYAPLISTGLPTAALTIDTDYTIAATGGSYLNGGVVTISPALGVTYTVKIVRRIKQSQETPQGAITPTSIVAALDKVTRMVQDAEDRKNRSIYIPESDAVSFDMVLPNSIDRVGKYLSFDSAGNVAAATIIEAGSVSFSTIGSNIAGAADAAAVRVLLGLDTGDNVAFTNGAFSGTLDVTGATELVGIVTIADASVTKTTAAPGADAQISNKKYVDDQITAISVKAWVTFDGSDADPDSTKTGYNITSITDNATGDFTITWDTDFASAAYAVVITAGDTGAGAAPKNVRIRVQAAGSVRIAISDSSHSLYDAGLINVIAIGTQ